MSQTRTTSVSVPTAMRRSSRSSEALCTRWPTRRHLNCPPLSASQRRTVLSADPLMIHRLSREYDTERTTSSCPRKSNSCSPVPTSHTPIVPSAEPVVTHRPLGEKDVQRILPRFADKPRSSSPPSARHKRIVPSQDPLRIRDSSGVRQCCDGVFVPSQAPYLPPRRRVPNANCSVGSAAHDSSAIRGIRHGIHSVLMPDE